jgi:hypothetical protein
LPSSAREPLCPLCEAPAAPLDGDPRAALKARVFLRELLGRINLKPEANGELWAEYGVQ